VWRFRRRAVAGFVVPFLLIASVVACASRPVRQSEVVPYKYVDFDPFPGMDVQGRQVALSQAEINGRVIWNLWSGGLRNHTQLVQHAIEHDILRHVQ
jgi:hypothetical protein